MRSITTRSSTWRTGASSPATRSGCPIASSTRSTVAFIVPTTTPTQFDPEQLVASLDRLLAYGPQALYLTHYSRVTDVPRLAESLKQQIREFVRIARGHRDAANRHEAISADMRGLWLELLRRHGCTLSDEGIDEVLGGDSRAQHAGADRLGSTASARAEGSWWPEAPWLRRGDACVPGDRWGCLRGLGKLWQLDGEHGALPGRTLHLDDSAQRLRAPPGDPESEPQASIVPRVDRSLQPLEDPLLVLLARCRCRRR